MHNSFFHVDHFKSRVFFAWREMLFTLIEFGRFLANVQVSKESGINGWNGWDKDWNDNIRNKSIEIATEKRKNIHIVSVWIKRTLNYAHISNYAQSNIQIQFTTIKTFF